MSKTTIGSWYKHIDNGGPQISVVHVDSGDKDDEENPIMHINIVCSTSYCGNPYVESTLFGGDFLSSEDFKEIGLMFLEVANKLKKK